MEINDIKDEYLKSLYLERELHQITIKYGDRLSPELVKKAREMLAVVEERIWLREYMIEKGLT